MFAHITVTRTSNKYHPVVYLHLKSSFYKIKEKWVKLIVKIRLKARQKQQSKGKPKKTTCQKKKTENHTIELT